MKSAGLLARKWAYATPYGDRLKLLLQKLNHEHSDSPIPGLQAQTKTQETRLPRESKTKSINLADLLNCTGNRKTWVFGMGGPSVCVLLFLVNE